MGFFKNLWRVREKYLNELRWQKERKATEVRLEILILENKNGKA